MSQNKSVEEVVAQKARVLIAPGIGVRYLTEQDVIETIQQERQTSQEREREIVEAERNRIKALFPPLNPNSDSWGTCQMERILKEITNPNKD